MSMCVPVLGMFACLMEIGNILCAQGGLYDGGSVLQHAALNSYAVEERALDHEVKRHLLTLPGKVIQYLV